MSLLELEYASLSPHLFVNLVKEYDGFSRSTVYHSRILRGGNLREQRKLLSSQDLLAYGGVYAWSVYLVPGGRFLLTAGPSFDRIALWDLGYNGYTDMKLTPIARLPRLDQADGPEDIKTVAPSSNGKDLVVVTHANMVE